MGKRRRQKANCKRQKAKVNGGDIKGKGRGKN
jgi:hypothetical protein